MDKLRTEHSSAQPVTPSYETTLDCLRSLREPVSVAANILQ